MKKYASVIVDIALEKLDHPFSYRIPEELQAQIEEGTEVMIPFGKGDKARSGFVVALSDRVDFPEEKLKDILSVKERSVGIESRTMQLAIWMRKSYGGTLITAMRTVLPVRKKIREKEYRSILREVGAERLTQEIQHLNPLRHAARIRLYRALLEAERLPESMVKEKLQISGAVLATAKKDGIIRIESERLYRAPRAREGGRKETELNEEQRQAAERIRMARAGGDRRPVLLYGITGSGKTEVYMELIAGVVAEGKQAIVLIPEIALTFQTLMRFYARFGDRVAVMHSRLSDGERYDQYERALKGELDIVIGPRSALFTPFPSTGIIIIDEEHEGSYKSEKMPKYHAREVAEYLAERDGAQLILGSATPSLESWYKAQKGEYILQSLTARYGGAKLPEVHIVDMREELKAGNRSFFSRALLSRITERITRGEQSMLFINRRGVAGFVSCRSCGYVATCPHCSVSMTEHRDGMLHCHYCGTKLPMPKRCPECGSAYIAGFRAGTERIEEELKSRYPAVRVLRMDADTTKNKEDYERILSAFADGEADILVGTQMIVKGHDFPNVTLVGALAADMSLNASDFHAAERSFQLLAQAAGRAGRGIRPGETVIQTYQPEHYAVCAAAKQDYPAFYDQEIAFRELAEYPPLWSMLALQYYSGDERACTERAAQAAQRIRECMEDGALELIGPAPALIGKLKDVFRVGIYLKAKEKSILRRAAGLAEGLQEEKAAAGGREVSLQLDYDPVNTF
ncbi:MAG: primosomal protein N' [Lachnospiraceae bacterium]|nr:primosomal protein N' [Lachnospiraceae bacterium]